MTQVNMNASLKIKSLGYDVRIGADSLKAIDKLCSTKRYAKVFILCDEHTFQHCLPELLYQSEYLQEAELLEIESGEQNKTLEMCMDLFRALTESGADRHSLMVNLGGGVIGDMGGFIASVFKRGFDFINVPTTLLSMADASVGGKTGVDFDGLKNHVGVIAQPAGVFIFPKFLETLPQREILGGLAEIIKAGLIADSALFAEAARLKSLRPEKINEIIYRSVTIKNTIVKKDPLEKGPRKALNFGHTVGHALETAMLSTSSPLLHGEAVAKGMLAEAIISYDLNLLSKAELKKIEQCIHKFYGGIKLPAVPAELLIELMKQDKKNRDGVINFVLLNGIGKCRIDCEVREEQLVKALRQVGLIAE